MLDSTERPKFVADATFESQVRDRAQPGGRGEPWSQAVQVPEDYLQSQFRSIELMEVALFPPGFSSRAPACAILWNSPELSLQGSPCGMYSHVSSFGVVQGSHLGLEIDDSTFRSVKNTCRRSKVSSGHFGVALTCFTDCLRVVYFPDLA